MEREPAERFELMRRKLRRGLLATRLLCALSFTAGGLTLASGEGGYYKHAAFFKEELAADEAAHQHPEDAVLQSRAEQAKHCRELSSNQLNYLYTSVGVWAVVLCSLGLVGMYIGDCFQRSINSLEDAKLVPLDSKSDRFWREGTDGSAR